MKRQQYFSILLYQEIRKVRSQQPDGGRTAQRERKPSGGSALRKVRPSPADAEGQGERGPRSHPQVCILEVTGRGDRS